MSLSPDDPYLNRVIAVNNAQLISFENSELNSLLRTYSQERELLVARIAATVSEDTFSIRHSQVILKALDEAITKIQTTTGTAINTAAMQAGNMGANVAMQEGGSLESKYGSADNSRQIASLSAMLPHRAMLEADIATQMGAVYKLASGEVKTLTLQLDGAVRSAVQHGLVSGLSSRQLVPNLAMQAGNVMQQKRWILERALRTGLNAAVNRGHNAGMKQMNEMLPGIQRMAHESLETGEKYRGELHRNHPFSLLLHGKVAEIDQPWIIVCGEQPVMFWPRTGQGYSGMHYPAHLYERGRQVPYYPRWSSDSIFSPAQVAPPAPAVNAPPELPEPPVAPPAPKPITPFQVFKAKKDVYEATTHADVPSQITAAKDVLEAALAHGEAKKTAYWTKHIADLEAKLAPPPLTVGQKLEGMKHAFDAVPAEQIEGKLAVAKDAFKTAMKEYASDEDITYWEGQVNHWGEQVRATKAAASAKQAAADNIKPLADVFNSLPLDAHEAKYKAALAAYENAVAADAPSMATIWKAVTDEWAKKLPYKAPAAWTDPKGLVEFGKDAIGGPGVPTINGIPLAPGKGDGYWMDMPALAAKEPDIVLPPKKKASAGCLVIEDDGRVWLIEPKDHYGGYEHTFPKGGIEPNMTLQQTAMKEVFEEAGLEVELSEHLGDFEGNTSVTRYYLAKRTGGAPWNAHWESQKVKLVSLEDAGKLLNTERDQKILAAYKDHLNSPAKVSIKKVQHVYFDAPYDDAATKAKTAKVVYEAMVAQGDPEAVHWAKTVEHWEAKLKPPAPALPVGALTSDDLKAAKDAFFDATSNGDWAAAKVNAQAVATHNTAMGNISNANIWMGEVKEAEAQLAALAPPPAAPAHVSLPTFKTAQEAHAAADTAADAANAAEAAKDYQEALVQMKLTKNAAEQHIKLGGGVYYEEDIEYADEQIIKFMRLARKQPAAPVAAPAFDVDKAKVAYWDAFDDGEWAQAKAHADAVVLHFQDAGDASAVLSWKAKAKAMEDKLPTPAPAKAFSVYDAEVGYWDSYDTSKWAQAKAHADELVEHYKNKGDASGVLEWTSASKAMAGKLPAPVVAPVVAPAPAAPVDAPKLMTPLKYGQAVINLDHPSTAYSPAKKAFLKEEAVKKLQSHKAALELELAGAKQAPKKAKLAAAIAEVDGHLAGAATAAPTVVVAPLAGKGSPPVFAQMRQVGQQGGSNLGGVFEDASGQKWYVKAFDNADKAKNEVLAADLYRMAGIQAPECHVIDLGSGMLGGQSVQGRTGFASKIIEGLSKNALALDRGEVAGVYEGFAVDAWLANWDVAGASFDNLLVKGGQAYRVDTGGALLYRAQGSAKGSAFGHTVTELETLRDSYKNANTSEVFKGMTDQQLMASMRRVAGISDKEIARLVNISFGDRPAIASELVDTLVARRNFIAKRLHDMEEIARRAALPQVPIMPGSGRTVDLTTMKAIKESGINGLSLPTDSHHIEDQQVLVWQEHNSANQAQTCLYLKLTEGMAQRMEQSMASGHTPGFNKVKGAFNAKTIKGKVAVEASGKVGSSYDNFGYCYEGRVGGASVRVWSNGRETPFALRGRVEVVAPGNDPAAVDRAFAALRGLGVDTVESSALDQEELYLRKLLYHRNELTDVLTSAVAGLGSPKERVEYLRKYASKQIGSDVTKLKGYDPAGKLQVFGEGRRHTYRPDLEGPEWDAFEKDYRLYHDLTYGGGDFVDKLRAIVGLGGGQMAPTTDKLRRGFLAGGGSPGADLESGGASYFFTRIKEKSSAHNRSGIVWKARQVTRLDSISYDSDKYGRCIYDDGRAGYVKNHRKTGIDKWKSIANNSSNETIFKDSLSIYEDIDIIKAPSGRRDEVIKVFHDAGVTKFPDGRKVEDVVR